MERKGITWRDFEAKSRSVYDALKPTLEAQYKGMVVAIEPESREYFIGRTVKEADERGMQRYPDRLFQFFRIGYPAVYVHK